MGIGSCPGHCGGGGELGTGHKDSVQRAQDVAPSASLWVCSTGSVSIGDECCNVCRSTRYAESSVCYVRRCDVSGFVRVARCAQCLSGNVHGHVHLCVFRIYSVEGEEVCANREVRMCANMFVQNVPRCWVEDCFLQVVVAHECTVYRWR